MIKRKKQGLLIVVSGPSGCGKSTLDNLILKKRDNIVMSISDTTRKLRNGVCTGDVATNSDHYDYKPCGSAKRAESLTGVSFISYFTPACPETNENRMVNPCAYTCESGYKAQKTSERVRECKR